MGTAYNYTRTFEEEELLLGGDGAHWPDAAADRGPLWAGFGCASGMRSMTDGEVSGLKTTLVFAYLCPYRSNLRGEGFEIVSMR